MVVIGYRNTSYTVIVARPLGEGDYIDEALIATITLNIFPIKLSIATIALTSLALITECYEEV